MLALLTDQPGLFQPQTRRNDPHAKLVQDVNEAEIPSTLWEAAGGITAQTLAPAGWSPNYKPRIWRDVLGRLSSSRRD